MISFSFLFLVVVFVVYGLLRRFTPRNDEKKNCHCEGLKSPWQSQYGVQLLIHGILFLFCFWWWFLWFVDCFASLAMTVPTHRHCESCFATRGNLVYSRLVIARVRRTRGNLSMATTAHNPHCHCETL